MTFLDITVFNDGRIHVKATTLRGMDFEDSGIWIMTWEEIIRIAPFYSKISVAVK